MEGKLILLILLIFLVGTGFGYALGYTNAIHFCAETALKVLDVKADLTEYGIYLVKQGVSKGIIK